MEILQAILLWIFEPLRWLFWVYVIFRFGLYNLARKYEKMMSKTVKQVSKVVRG
jgi:hypothetical protein